MYERCHPPLEHKLKEATNYLHQGDAKTAITELSQLEGAVLSHAQFYYLLGKAYFQQGEFQQARKYWVRANSFDCTPAGSSHVLNNIIRSKARENAVTLIDWDQMVNAHLGKSTIFLPDQYYPQDYYYDYFLDDLATLMNRHLKTLQKKHTK